jgi:hypothetical protein
MDVRTDPVGSAGHRVQYEHNLFNGIKSIVPIDK